MEDQHIYHHNDPTDLRINVKVERNTKGYNYEATVVGAKSIDEAIRLVDEAIARLKATYATLAIQD